MFLLKKRGALLFIIDRVELLFLSRSKGGARGPANRMGGTRIGAGGPRGRGSELGACGLCDTRNPALLRLRI